MARTVGMYANLSLEERKKALRKDKRKARIYKIKSFFTCPQKHFGKIISGIALVVTVLRGIIGLFFDLISLFEYIF